MYFTIELDADGYRARLWAANNELVWWTEGYTKKSNAENAVRIAQGSYSAAVYDRT
jgi:uncharacterized protein YegP (UPF0339 family)